jgi:hypothetical protein
MENYKNEICNDDIMLDPRLRNYIQYRKAYERDCIDTGVSLEKMFQISNEDLQTIRQFTRGKRDFYTLKKLGSSQANFIKPIKQKFENINEKFKKDPHYKKLQEKMQKNRDAQKQRTNYSTIKNNYNMYSDNELTDRTKLNVKYKQKIATITPYDQNYKSRNKYKKNEFLLNNRRRSGSGSCSGSGSGSGSDSGSCSGSGSDSGSDSDSDSDSNYDLKYDNPNYISQLNKRKTMIYHDEPKISINERLRSNKFNELNKYKKNHDISHIRQELRNIDVDTDMRFGQMNNMNRGGKSIGYKNPFEHYFQYIDNDIQNKHSQNLRGISSRLYNKSRKYKRDIYR